MDIKKEPADEAGTSAAASAETQMEKQEKKEPADEAGSSAGAQREQTGTTGSSAGASAAEVQEQGTKLMTIVIWDVNGVEARRHKIKDYIDNNESVDVMCLSRTLKINPSDYKHFVEMFTCHSHTVSSESVACLIKNSYQGQQFNRKKNLEASILWITFAPKKCRCLHFIFAVIHIPANEKEDSKNYNKTLEILKREYAELWGTFPAAIFIICGNMNAHIIDGQNDFEAGKVTRTLPKRQLEAQQSATKYHTQHGKNLIDFCQLTGFRIVNGRFGRTSGRCTTKARTRKHVYEYVLCRENSDWDLIQSLSVGDNDHGSGRFPLTLTLKYSKCQCTDKIAPDIDLECLAS